MMGKAEQFKGKIEQVVGVATGSRETQGRGELDEAKGRAREKVADVKDDIDNMTGKAWEAVSGLKGDVNKIAGNAQETFTEFQGTRLNIAGVVIGIVVAAISILLYRHLRPARRVPDGAVE
jgi:uncharacterized protein YjbJ (UPF0337 family)